MNKQQLAAKIWESANKMRSKIEANEYKDYILGFIFYKFLSETEVTRLHADGMGDEDLEELREDDTETAQYVRDLCGYFISYDNLFSTWVAKKGGFRHRQCARRAFRVRPQHRPCPQARVRGHLRHLADRPVQTRHR